MKNQETNMITFSNTIHIDRPVDEVRTYLTDLEHAPEWNVAIVDSRKLTSGPPAVGSRYEQVRQAPRPGSETIEITAMQPALLEVTGPLAGIPARLTYRWTTAASGTDLVNDVELNAGGVTGVLATLAQSRIRRAVAENLETLRAVLERRSDDPPSGE